jgi:adenylate cyclase
VTGVQTCALPISSRLLFENTTPQEQLFILERSEWNAQATPAADVTTLQTFRDLFASEALRPGEPISVGSLAIVFTDLRGSTRLYREIGDAPAFGSVMEHFDVLREAIAQAGGAVVKTMGDAVMAVFRRPAEAFQAMLAAQQHLSVPPAGERPFWLKVAIQYGPVIAINANDRLDYFGTYVNLVARMVDLSSGEDIILSEGVFRDQEVAAVIAASHLQADPFDASFKGFDQEEFHLWRVRKSAENKL